MLRTWNSKPSLGESDPSTTALWQKLSISARALQDSCSTLTYRFDKVLATHLESKQEGALEASRSVVYLNTDAVYA